MNRAENLIKQIDQLLTKFPEVEESWYSSNMGGFFQDKVGYETLVTEVMSLVTHIYGNHHVHSQRVFHAYNQTSLNSLRQMKGVLVGTKENIMNGLIDTITENITVDIKTDFLETAREFNEKGDKDPAAVLACCVLEDSLKKLAVKNGINDLQDKLMGEVAKSLFSKDIIEKTTLSAIVSFKNLRNAAFHAGR